jgi:hypothetical protein
MGDEMNASPKRFCEPAAGGASITLRAVTASPPPYFDVYPCMVADHTVMLIFSPAAMLLRCCRQLDTSVVEVKSAHLHLHTIMTIIMITRVHFGASACQQPAGEG